MRTQSIFATVLGIALTGGCASQATMHYDLKSFSAVTENASGRAATPIAYMISSVTVPEPLDINTLVVRQPNDSLLVLSHDQWVAPLGQVIRGAVSTTLTEELGMPPLQGVMITANPRMANVMDVLVDVQAFELLPAKEAKLGVLWRIDYNDKAKQVLTCYSTYATTVAPGVLALVDAQQKNLKRLSKEISSAMINKKSPPSANCRTGA